MNIYIALHLPYFICVFFEIFKKTNSILCLKLFYLFVHYSHVALDYDSIYTILPFIFSKIFVYFFFFPLEWYFFKNNIILRKKNYNQHYIKLHLTLFLGISHLILLCDFKISLNFLNLIMHQIFVLVTLHLIYFTYLGDEV